MKILQNVFISSADNRLMLIDLIFNSKIKKIIPKMSQEIDWRDIATNEKWEKFKKNFPAQPSSFDAEVYDGNYLLLMPGAIDAHVHFNTPGFEDRDDFEHGSLAAAHGGVTTVIDMPCTSIPPLTSVENLKVKLNAIKKRSWVDYAFWGGVSGNDFKAYDEPILLRKMGELVRRGVVGFKSYFISGMPTFEVLEFDQMMEVAMMAAACDSILAVHAEDKALVTDRQLALQKKGSNDWQAYCQARDDLAEAKAVTKLIEILRRTDCRIHVVHLSSKLALEQISRAQKEGLLITTETCPHYLCFIQQDFENKAISNFLKTAPPVKQVADRDALWQGLQDGSILFVTTDHAGCDPIKEKSSWNFWEVYGGIPGVEHRVPFLFSEGFKKGRLTLSQTIDLLSINVAKFFDLSSKGSLEIGNDADLALINLWDKLAVKAENMHSKGKYTPFEGMTYDAVVDATFVRGKMVMNSRGKAEVGLGFGKPVFVEK